MEESWNTFWGSGKVQDYLKYIDAKNKTGELLSADNGNGNSPERKSLG